MAKHPIQPLVSEDGRLRYLRNNAVETLYQKLVDLGIDPYALINSDAKVTEDDVRQFTQLVGYSHAGATRATGVDDETYYAAKEMYDSGVSELQVRNKYLERRHKKMVKKLAPLVSHVFNIDLDDLEPR